MIWKRIRPHLPKVIVAAYLLLGVVYSISSPILEAPDERWHYPYVHYVATERRLPPWDTHSPAKQESSQPPLYYAVAALATAWVDASDLETMLQHNNPYWGYPAAGRVNDNKNLFFHPDAETFPWTGTALAVHIARLVNLGFGALAVVGTYLLAREIFPKRSTLAAAAAALVALNPQFLFISAAVNNDAAVGAFSTVALWLLVRGLQRGYTLRAALQLGLAIGLATLSKVSALALLPLALFAVGLHTWCQYRQLPPLRRLRRIISHPSLIILVTLIVSGWWCARNAVLYDDPFGLNTHFETQWAHEEPLPPGKMWSQLPSVELSFWAAFGWGNVHLPRTFYVALWILVRLAILGLVVWVVRSWRAGRRPGRRAWSLALLALWIVIVFIALLRWMQLVEAALGRLLFPAIGAIVVLMTWGLVQLVPSHVAVWASSVPHVSCCMPAALVAVVLCAAVASPFVAIMPAYAQPPLLSEEEIAARTDPTDVRFGDGIRLVGYDLSCHSAPPGEEIAVTLCWKALGSMSKDYAYFVHFLGRDDSIVGARDTYPGLGRFPTSQWASGDAFCDVVRVPVEEWAPTQAVYDVEIGWYEPDSKRRLAARDATGTPIELVLLDSIRVPPQVPPVVEVPNPVNANLGGKVALLGYDVISRTVAPGERIDVTLYWEAQTSPLVDYTVFVHLAAPSGPPYAQDDSQPRDGAYPTSFWDVGEVVADTHAVHIPGDLPAGDYPLVAGMYLLETGKRLPALNAQGERFPADAVRLVTLELRPEPGEGGAQ